MKRILLLILSLIMLTAFAASAETAYESWLPESASEVAQIDAGKLKIINYAIPETGEQLSLTVDSATGDIRMLYGACAAAEGAPMDAESAKALLAEIYPDAKIISSAEETVDGVLLRKLNIVSPDFLGYMLFDSEKHCVRDLDFAVCMKDGRLTMQGAVSILKLLRSDATIAEIELDDDDGLLLYEGNAYISGVEYEFELDAHTGKLLQWDRD